MIAAGRPIMPHHRIGIEVEVRLVPHGQNHGIRALQRRGQVFLHLEVAPARSWLRKKPFPGVTRRRVGVLFFELPPVLDVGIVHRHLGAHLGQLAHDDLRAAVAGVADVLAVGGAQQGDVGGRPRSCPCCAGHRGSAGPRAGRGCR